MTALQWSNLTTLQRCHFLRDECGLTEKTVCSIVNLPLDQQGKLVQKKVAETTHFDDLDDDYSPEASALAHDMRKYGLDSVG